ncbi:MAG: RtcB family protein [Oscillospiraceae bacterium]|nr:RtcB family protein [Oscillospiraceae bacterium]
MLEIKGKIGTAIAYASVIEDEAVEQIRRMCDYGFTEGSRIRIMPDVHAGAGCTIGTTMTVADKVVPNIVGVDIGCGMYTVDLGKADIDMERFDEACHFIPSGFDVWDKPAAFFDLGALRCSAKLKDTGRLVRSLGTLGGGNHFIEIDRAADGTNYLVIHTGSRQLGLQTAKHYQSLAVELAKGKEDYTRQREQIIEELKASGRKQEIQGALASLKMEYEKRDPEVPEDLCWLYGSYMDDYLHDVSICQAFARQNREKIAGILLDRTGICGGEAFHTIHNYIDTGEMMLRKGAIAAHKGEKVLIPINMRDGSVLAVGKGNDEWNQSAPHGAGRIMSRAKAFQTLDIQEYKKQMEGVYTTSVNSATLDESPMAYKSLDDIIGVIGDTVDIIEVLKPIYNFKAD